MTTPDLTFSDDTSIRIVRTIPAPADRVVRAWTDVAWFARWFGQPHGTIPLETAAMDARPGGKWSIVMHFGEMRLPFLGEFVEISPTRVVLTLTDQPDDPAGASPITVDLAPTADGGTVMTFAQVSPGLGAEQLAQAREGWAGFFAALAGVAAAG
jgi:uncharacterized protein YndB with AHSA1/START domain